MFSIIVKKDADPKSKKRPTARRVLAVVPLKSSVGGPADIGCITVSPKGDYEIVPLSETTKAI